LGLLVFAAILLWIADVQALKALFPLLFFSSLFIFIIISYALTKIEDRKEKALKNFLLKPDKDNEKALFDSFGTSKEDIIRVLADTLHQKQAEIDHGILRLSDYEDYVELWAHEIKLPLSLLTLILDNQGDSLPQNLSFKLDYIRNQIQNNVSQILFYYRVKSEKKDYFLEEVNLKDCVQEIMQDFAPLVHEKNMNVELKNLDHTIYTDRRSFEFIIGQIVSNAIKYSDKEACLHIWVDIFDDTTTLTLKDNGQGVKACDLPYIFEKGFTGDSGETRKKSTGMGLFLVKQLADDLNIGVEVSSDWEQGFSISFVFPSSQTLTNPSAIY
jgi:signal transduction histidine kinase